ncbi:hypothetical protein PMAC_001942 [Pneumocystis sp. 'macacae']|nr:hypothetical protein PMAC_001942 [Pneumocystis sp. 'macacae']
MVYINNIKYACSSCIRGHRSSLCDHENRQLFEIKRKGRPVSQCLPISSARAKRSFRAKCLCKDYIGKVKEFSDSQKLVFKTSKKNHKIVLETTEDKGVHEGVRKNKTFTKDLYINTSELDFNGLNKFKQFHHFPVKLQMLNSADVSKCAIGAVSNETCDFSPKIYTQSFDFNPSFYFNSNFPSGIFSYYNSQYSNTHIYPPLIGKNGSDCSAVSNDTNFYQTCNKLEYENLNTISNYSMPSEIKENFQESFTPVFFDHTQSSRVQNNNSNIEISEPFMKSQTVIDDFQNFEIPETYYELDCSKVGSKCTCTSVCQCTNCYTHDNNTINNILQNIPQERALLDTYIISRRKPSYIIPEMNTRI